MTLVDDLKAAKIAFMDGSRSAQDACMKVTGDLTGGFLFRCVVDEDDGDRSIGWIGRLFDRAIANAEQKP